LIACLIIAAGWIAQLGVHRRPLVVGSKQLTPVQTLLAMWLGEPRSLAALGARRCDAMSLTLRSASALVAASVVVLALFSALTLFTTLCTVSTAGAWL
jgi:hypothetical protein